MRASILCCALLALVAVTQVTGYNDRVSNAKDRIKKDTESLKKWVDRRLTDRVEVPVAKEVSRSVVTLAAAERVVTALVTRIQSKSDKHKECGKTEETDKNTKKEKAKTDQEECSKDIETTLTDLRKSLDESVALVIKKSEGDYTDCAPLSDTSRARSESRRCVDRRYKEWKKLLQEIERSWKRIVNNRDGVLVKRAQRCLFAAGKPYDDAIKALTAAVLKCDKDIVA